MTILRLPVQQDGSVRELVAIGYHGTVRRDRTPALQAPVLADAHGFLCAVLEHDRNASTVIVERSEVQSVAGRLPGDGTRIDPGVPARPGWGFLVVGDSEIEHAQAIARAQNRNDPEDARAFANFLATRTNPGLEVRLPAEGVIAWYCSLVSAASFRARVRTVAVAALRCAAGKHERETVERNSWWLQRASADDYGYVLAAAGLKHADSPHWMSVARAVAPNREIDELEADVERIRRRLVDEENAARPEYGRELRPPQALGRWGDDILEVWRSFDPAGAWAIRWKTGEGGGRFLATFEERAAVTISRASTPNLRGRTSGRALELWSPPEVPKDKVLAALRSWSVDGSAAYQTDDFDDRPVFASLSGEAHVASGL